jgi:hypothetical protein
MRAIVYTKYGSPSVLKIKDVEKPSPGNDDVLIKVHAAEVTKFDCELRSFKFQVNWFWLPLRVFSGLFKPKKQILGGYFSGVIESVGKNVFYNKEDFTKSMQCYDVILIWLLKSPIQSVLMHFVQTDATYWQTREFQTY